MLGGRCFVDLRNFEILTGFRGFRGFGLRVLGGRCFVDLRNFEIITSAWSVTGITEIY